MESAELFVDLLIDNGIIRDGALPAHPADEPDRLHVHASHSNMDIIDNVFGVPAEPADALGDDKIDKAPLLASSIIRLNSFRPVVFEPLSASRQMSSNCMPNRLITYFVK